MFYSFLTAGGDKPPMKPPPFSLKKLEIRKTHTPTLTLDSYNIQLHHCMHTDVSRLSISAWLLCMCVIGWYDSAAVPGYVIIVIISTLCVLTHAHPGTYSQQQPLFSICNYCGRSFDASHRDASTHTCVQQPITVNMPGHKHCGIKALSLDYY